MFFTGMCHLRNKDPCRFSGPIPEYMFFQCPSNEEFGELFSKYGALYGFLWFLSSIWISQHIWFSKCHRLAPIEEIFGTPYYCGLLVEQSMALNRQSENAFLKKQLKSTIRWVLILAS